MTLRRHLSRLATTRWAAIPGLATLAAGALVLSAYSGASSPQGRGPDQPIAFPHPVHVQKLGMNCLYCHSAANKSPDPGMPAVNTCMGCHAIVGPKRPKSDTGPERTSTEIQKLHDYADSKGFPPIGPKARPIPWVRIHKVPEYVRFPHNRHVTAGVTCQTCHGEIQNMRKVSQAASLNMGWCVNCHVKGYDPAAGRKLAESRDPETAVAQQGAAQTAAPASQTQPPSATNQTNIAPAHADQRRRARYDCAICHY